MRKVFSKISYWLASFGKRQILVLGDSHASVFKGRVISNYSFKVVSVGGATISGLKNPNSASRALPEFLKAIDRYKGNIYVTLMGEVDTGFVIWYRAKKHNLSIQESLMLAIENYINFLSDLVGRGKVIVISAPLPTIKDGQNWGDVANKRKSISVSQKQRTELTLEFNNQIRDFANQSGIYFLDLDKSSIGADGVVKNELLNANNLDHHYDQEAYFTLIEKEFKNTLQGLI